MRISERGKNIQASPIRRLVPLADSAKKRGIKVYHLNIGQPDIPTPEPVYEAIRNFNEKVLSYGPSQGLPELREEIAKYFNEYGIDLSMENVLITVGGSEAIHFAFSVIADPGDEIIIPEPYYTNYNGYASFAGIKIVPVTSKAEDGYRLPSVEEIESKITPRTKGILICSPNNPTGTVYNDEELGRIVYLAKKYDIFIIGDEVYKEFIYDGLKHRSILELKGVEDRTIVVDSISKRFSSCGARIGAIITRNKEVMDSLVRFAQARLCPPTIEQVGAIAAYRMGISYFKPINEEYQRRRDAMFSALERMEGVAIKKPQGAFYIFAKLPVDDADEFAQWLLRDFSVDGETVMVAPGNGFYGTEGLGKNEVRLAYVLNVESINRAMAIFEKGLKEFRSR
jgi:aspartate aminotransferase